MITMTTILFTLLTRFLLVIFLIFISIPLLLCLLLPRRLLVNNKIFSILSQLFYWFCIKFSFLPITIKGIKNIPDEPVIIVANHQSSFDIPLIGYILGSRIHVWLAWAQLTQTSLLRFILTRNSLLVDMSSPTKGLRTLIQAINTLKDTSWDLIIFPEGGRYTDGSIHPFFGGFSVIAKKLKRPVIPIKIIGVNKVYPPNTFWIYYNPITVIIGKPMIMQLEESDKDFTNRVYQWFIQETRED
jgi:1-acyl-sn-glycerol-3-phosphate acyltransferase